MNTRYKESLARRTLYNEGRGAPKKWALCPEYQTVLDRYINSLTGKATHTKRIYRSGAAHFLTFLEERWQASDLEALSQEHAQTYLDFLVNESGYGSNAIGGFIIAGRKLAGYLIDKDVIERQPFDGLDGVPSPTSPDVKILSADDVQTMVEAAKRDRTIWGKRDIALMMCLWYGGFRRAELLKVRAVDIDWKRGTVSVPRGKGGDPRTIGLDDRAMLALDRYDTARQKYLRDLRPYRRKLLEDGPIWLNQRGGHLGEMGVALALKARAQRAGVTVPVNVHAWRHAAATHDADAGMGEMMMRDKYGWSSTSSMPFRYSRQTLRERTIHRSQNVRAGDGVKI